MITEHRETEFGPETVHTCTAAEAISLLKKSRGKGSLYMIMARVDLPIENSDNKVFPSGAAITISLSDMLKVVANSLSDILENRGARIRIYVRPRHSSAKGFIYSI